MAGDMVDDAIKSLHTLFFTSLLVLLLWLLTWPAATEKIRLYHATAEVTAWAAMRTRRLSTTSPFSTTGVVSRRNTA